MRNLTLFLLMLISLFGCAKTEEETKAELAKIMKPYYRQKAEEQAKVVKEFEYVTDAQLSVLLNECRAAIFNKAKEQYKPFEPFFVDGDSADSLQADIYLSGGRVEKGSDISTKIKQYRESSKRYATHTPSSLNTSFSLMVTQDSFSGPQRRGRTGYCEILPSLKVQAEWESGNY